MIPVRDLSFKKGQSVSSLVGQWERGGGFSAKKLADAARILRDMARGECTKFLSFPAALMATGARGALVELVKNRRVDVVVTTCGTWDHDLARTWRDYYHGAFEADDADLRKRGINRLGNVFVPNESYGLVLEGKLQPALRAWYAAGTRGISTAAFSWKLGELVSKERNPTSSLLYWAWRNQISVVVPAPTDGAVGYQAWEFAQDHAGFFFDLFADEKRLADAVFEAKRTGALMIGGGVSKHHVIWWNQFREGLDYAVQLTSAPEWDGSLSGARTREAISWGKIKARAKHVTVEGDATVLLPLLVQSLVDAV